jgi:anti-sigma regulatory factor (Ser/Thr protein kinase)
MDGLATIAPDDGRATHLDEVELLRLRLAPVAESPGHARKCAARVLDGSPHLDVVLVLVSELVTNAVLHARGGAELTMTRRYDADSTSADATSADSTSADATNEVIRVEVRDRDRDVPESAGAPGAHGGFGLRIVAALAREWGYSPLADGKIVWFEIGGR